MARRRTKKGQLERRRLEAKTTIDSDGKIGLRSLRATGGKEEYEGGQKAHRFGQGKGYLTYDDVNDMAAGGSGLAGSD